MSLNNIDENEKVIKTPFKWVRTIIDKRNSKTAYSIRFNEGEALVKTQAANPLSVFFFFFFSTKRFYLLSLLPEISPS